jgi:hypothetical protein
MKISQAGRHQRNQEAYENDESDGKPKKKKKTYNGKIVKIRRSDSTSKPPPPSSTKYRGRIRSCSSQKPLVATSFTYNIDVIIPLMKMSLSLYL